MSCSTRLHVDARLGAVRLRPFARGGITMAWRSSVREPQREARGQVLQLGRQLDLVADQHERCARRRS